jgi:signal transduction histidine kinase
MEKVLLVHPRHPRSIMEGTPARGLKLGSLGSILVDLNTARTLAEFHDVMLNDLSGHLQRGKPFLLLQDSDSDALDFDRLSSSDAATPISAAWLKSYIERHPELLKKLQQSEMVGIPCLEETKTPQSVTGLRRNLFISPIIAEDILVGAVGLAVPAEGLENTEDEVDLIRQVSHYAAPIFSRLQELERLREAYRGIEALRATVEMQTHLQSNVAHELRTPLATVRGYARMILDGKAGDVPQTQREYLSIVTENANRLINLVNWMSRVLQYGAQHLKLESADLREVWKDCLNSHEADIREKSIRIQQQIPVGSFTIMCDRQKLSFVLKSLLATAIQCSDAGGEVSVEFTRGRHREITVKISDSSKALSSESVNKIFERYNGSSLPATNPTELGMAGVYDIIGMHGGRLFVNNRAGEGSTYLVTLPAVGQETEESSSDKQAVNTGRRRR